MDIKSFTDVLVHGTPLAILVAVVGLLWQTVYALLRDHIHDNQAERELKLEQQKFDHQHKLEDLKFTYAQKQWREQLACELTVKLVDARLEEYSKLWSCVRLVARSGMQNGSFTPAVARDLAEKVQAWRFSKGGLLAEETTRGAAYTLQTALWDFDGTLDSFHRAHSLRFVLRNAIRADIGLTGDVFQRTEERFQQLRHELDKFNSELAPAKATKDLG